MVRQFLLRETHAEAGLPLENGGFLPKCVWGTGCRIAHSLYCTRRSREILSPGPADFLLPYEFRLRRGMLSLPEADEADVIRLSSPDISSSPAVCLFACLLLAGSLHYGFDHVKFPDTIVQANLCSGIVDRSAGQPHQSRQQKSNGCLQS